MCHQHTHSVAALEVQGKLFVVGKKVIHIDNGSWRSPFMRVRYDPFPVGLGWFLAEQVPNANSVVEVVVQRQQLTLTVLKNIIPAGLHFHVRSNARREGFLCAAQLGWLRWVSDDGASAIALIVAEDRRKLKDAIRSYLANPQAVWGFQWKLLPASNGFDEECAKHRLLYDLRFPADLMGVALDAPTEVAHPAPWVAKLRSRFFSV